MELIDRIKAGVTAFKDAFCAPRYPMGKPKMLDELLKSYKKLADAPGLLSNKGEMTICLTENSWYITSACRRGSNIFLDGTGEK